MGSSKWWGCLWYMCIDQERSLGPESIQVVDHLIRKLVDVWADPVFIMHGTHQEQECMYWTYLQRYSLRIPYYLDITSGLLVAAGYLPKEQLQHVVLDTSLMAHIHRWFQSKDMTTAKIGVVRIYISFPNHCHYSSRGSPPIGCCWKYIIAGRYRRKLVSLWHTWWWSKQAFLWFKEAHGNTWCTRTR